MHLFKFEVKALGYDRQFGHVFFRASWMTAYEIGYDLLAQILFPVNLVKNLLKLLELPERWLPHKLKHAIRSMFRRHFQPSAHMLTYQLTRIFACGVITFLVFAFVQQKVVAHSAAYKTFLYARKCVNRAVYVEQAAVVCVKIRTYPRVDARRTLAPGANILVASAHAIHVGRRTSQVAYVPFEIRHFRYLPHLLEYAVFAS